MAAVNKVFLLGNLGSDLTLRHMPDGRAVANVNLATTEVWRDQEGNKVKHTEWHRLNFYGRQAEIASEYLHKGSPLFIEGQLRTRKWQDSDGNDRQTTEVRVLNFQMIGGRQDSQDNEGRSYRSRDSAPRNERESAPAKGGEGGLDELEEDLPW